MPTQIACGDPYPQYDSQFPVGYYANNQVQLHSTTDAEIWAKEFLRIHQNVDLLSEESLRGWFANSIMVGWDAHSNAVRAKQKAIVDENARVLRHIVVI